MKFGFVLHGVGSNWSDWRHPDVKTDASTNFAFYKEQAQLAEAGKFDFLFVSDSISISDKSSPHDLNRFEPITLLSALAAVTDHIGLVGTLTVSYSEPFNVARQFASLDQLSNGRAGWNVVTSWLDGTAANFGQAALPPHDVRYKIADEYLDVVEGLWDSWEDGAIIGDKASGRFIDPDRLHTLNHKGEHFDVRGPLNIKRTPQGHPVIFQAGASEDGKNFASRRADAIFCNPNTLEAAVEYYSDVKGRAQAFGRDPNAVKILPSFRPIIGRTDEEAEAKYKQLRELVSIDSALKLMARSLNDMDFSAYDLDAPFPVEDALKVGAGGHQSNTLRIVKMAQDGNLTLRETALRHATPRGSFIGGPEKIADAMDAWFQAHGADGFNFFESMPGQLALFIEQVVPILQARGLYRKDYDAATFRGLLEVAQVQNRYTKARSEARAVETA
jgi:FMN-dependent oxidoreductase (nitrilotriacetate monooxygenase family)